ncbi:MAG TPA: S8 family serine peptidase [Verrucomicrobiae bacterium]|nr:S8 family serine peptidase [Verrucomicrobiae bacterium]
MNFADFLPQPSKAVIGFLLLLGGVSGGWGAGAHRVQIDDPAAEKEMLAQGASLLADYGAYRIYDTDVIPPGAQPRDEYRRLFLNAAPLDTAVAARRPLTNFAGRHLHLVQFSGPVKPEWRRQLEAMGVRIVHYIPQNGYLVYGEAEALRKLPSAGHVQWEGGYLDEYKTQPSARRQAGIGLFSIQLCADPPVNAGTLQVLRRLARGDLHPRHVLDYINLIASLRAADLPLVAACPDVVSIHAWSAPQRVDERQDQIVASNLTGNIPSSPGYLAWLAGKGFTQGQFDASGFAVDISDSGIDNGSTQPNHFGLYEGGQTAGASRIIYNRLIGTPNPPDSTIAGCDGHGTLDAHIVGGYDNFAGYPFSDTSGYHYGLGVCPFVRMGSSVVFDPETWTFPDLGALQSQAYQDGARVSNNSWGDDGHRGGYDIESQELDALVRDAQPASSPYPTPGNQEMTIVFAAGNTSRNGTIIDEPGGTAKNVICVGAADGVQPFNDGYNDDGEAVSASQIASFSDTGPCNDGRLKPDLVAPGTHITGGAPEASSPDTDGTADSCFFNYGARYGFGVTGTGNGNPFFPADQQYYVVSDGTSHAAPAVAGGCALLRQYFINQGLAPPSPAMTKAFLMNSARYLAGSTANDTLWSPKQGMGELNLGAAFDGAARLLRDELSDDLFTASGQARTFHGSVASAGHPFLVTVAWTDAPGSTTGAAYNNDLDLTVDAGGQAYRGNVFSGRWSIPGGAADFRNNVESVFLPAGVTGPFTVTVTAASINSVGVPNVNNALEQDFALVINNALGAGPAVIVPAGATLSAENCVPANGVIDPGETVTVRLGLRNSGLVNTTNLVATLLSTNGVQAISGPQTYGVLAAEGPAIALPFTFMATGACGSTVSATLQLRDGAALLGMVDFSFTLCQRSTALTENFANAVSPTLPAGWQTVPSAGTVAWITDTNGAVFAAAATNAGVTDLISPPVMIHSGDAQLSFRQQFNLELDPSDSTLAFDGGFLEISMGGGAFADILDAGAAFVTNGYNTTIANNSVDNNPFPGRKCWSGGSAGFLSTVVQLPASVAGQAVQFKWRCATDYQNAYGSVGWWLDDVTVSDGFSSVCCGCPAPPLLLNPNIMGSNFVFSFQTATNRAYTVQATDSLTNGAWNSLPAIPGDGSPKTVTNALAPGARFYRVEAQ